MLTVIGEGLIDVVQRSSGVQAHVGGSPLNVAVGLARLDHPVQFVGRYGRDAYGEAVAAHLKSSSVLLPVGPDELPTSVATAVVDDGGAASYTFELAWELPGLADRLPFMLQATTLLHTGSIATMLAPGAADVLSAVEHAHPSVTISFDPNCRPSIITDVDYARRQAEKFVTLADVVKASDEDLTWLYPDEDPLDSARRWLSLGGSEGPAMVVVTRGAQGPWGANASGEAHFPAPSVQVADTVGAGDSFMAALLSGIVDLGLDGAQNRKDLRELSAGSLRELLAHAAWAAAVTVSRAGANPPTRAELNRMELNALASAEAAGSDSESAELPRNRKAAMTPSEALSFRVSSESFQDGQTLPPAQRGASTGAGAKDESPQLSWSGAPAGTLSYAVTVFDPDAPGRGFWHWAVADLPASVTSLPAGAGARQGGQLPSGAIQLKNDGGGTGYMGAAPPKGHGVHRYVVTVHALDVAHAGVDAGVSPAKLEAALAPHTLARASLTGTYERH